MKELSDLLKRTRTSKNLSIEEISAQTKIQIHILKSLEEGQVENLPNKIYLRGFLRQYARALGLKESEVIDLYERENESSAPPAPPKPTQQVSRLDSQQLQDKTNVLWFRAPAKFITVAGIAIIVFLITSIYFLSMKIVSYSQETVKEPVATESTEPPSPSETPQLEKIIDKKEESLALPKPNPPTEPANTDSGPPPEEAKPKIVTIEAADVVTVEASWSTGKKETVNLKANSRHVFYYAKKIKLVVSDGGGVTVTANEKDLGKPGEAGKPVTLNFE